MKFLSVYLAIIMAVLSTGCVSKKPALDTIDALKENQELVSKAHRELEIQLLTNVFRMNQNIILAKIDKNEALDLVEIYKLSEEKENSVINTALNHLEVALEPQIENMTKALKEAQSVGNRKAEFEIAAQLSATLAVFGKEKIKLRRKIIDKIASARASAIVNLEKKYSVARSEIISEFDPRDLAEQTLSSFSTTVDKNNVTTQDALNKLAKHININRLAIKAFVDGVIPDGGIKTIAEIAGFGDISERTSDKASNFLDSIEGKLAKLSTEVITSAYTRLSKVN